MRDEQGTLFEVPEGRLFAPDSLEAMHELERNALADQIEFGSTRPQAMLRIQLEAMRSRKAAG